MYVEDNVSGTIVIQDGVQLFNHNDSGSIWFEYPNYEGNWYWICSFPILNFSGSNFTGKVSLPNIAYHCYVESPAGDDIEAYFSNNVYRCFYGAPNFSECENYNSPIVIPNSVSVMPSFSECTNFNSPITFVGDFTQTFYKRSGGEFVPANLYFMEFELMNCVNFNQDLYLPNGVSYYVGPDVPNWLSGCYNYRSDASFYELPTTAEFMPWPKFRETLEYLGLPYGDYVLYDPNNCVSNIEINAGENIYYDGGCAILNFDGNTYFKWPNNHWSLLSTLSGSLYNMEGASVTVRVNEVAITAERVSTLINDAYVWHWVNL